MQITYGDTNGKFTIQFCMREKEAAMYVNAVHHAFVQHFQLSFIIHASRTSAETDCAERGRSHALKCWRLINPLCKKLTQAHMFSNTSSQSFLPKITHNHPEFQRTVATTAKGSQPSAISS